MVAQPHPSHHLSRGFPLALVSMRLRGILCLTDEKSLRYSQTRTSQAQTPAHWRCRAVSFPTMVSASSRCGPRPSPKSPNQHC